LVGNPTLAFQPWELEFTTLNDVYVLGPITDPPEVFANNLVISQLRAFQVDKGVGGTAWSKVPPIHVNLSCEDGAYHARVFERTQTWI
jgi:hypothetical protein